MPKEALTTKEALRDLLRSMQQDPMAQFDQAAVDKALKAAQKADKDRFKPVAKWLKAHGGRPPPGGLLQACLEAPELAPLRDDAAHLLDEGGVKETVLVRTGREPQPKREVLALHVSAGTDRVHAAESKGTVSSWSLTTGAHLEDVKVATKALVGIAPRAQGGLRVLAVTGEVYERAEGAAAFKRTHKIESGETHRLYGRFVLWNETTYDADSGEETVSVHWLDCDSGARQTYPVKAKFRGDSFLPSRELLLVHQPESIELIELATAKVTGTIAIPEGHTFERLVVDSRERLYLSVDRNRTTLRADVDLDARTVTLLELGDGHAEKWNPWRGRALWLSDSVYLSEGTTELRRADGSRIAEYEIVEDHNRLTTAVDPMSGRIILAGTNIKMPLLVVAPYDPSATRTAPPAPIEAAPPPSWATPGARLSVTVGDFDAEDRFDITVVSSEGGLVLELLREGDEAPTRVTFADAALQSAAAFSSFLQDFDFTAGEVLTDKLPPFLISRDMAAKLKSGAQVTYRSAWLDDAETLMGATAATASLEVDGASRTVQTLLVSADGVQLVILDDTKWPLLLERRETDPCRVRVESLRTK